MRTGIFPEKGATKISEISLVCRSCSKAGQNPLNAPNRVRVAQNCMGPKGSSEATTPPLEPCLRRPCQICPILCSKFSHRLLVGASLTLAGVDRRVSCASRCTSVSTHSYCIALRCVASHWLTPTAFYLLSFPCFTSITRFTRSTYCHTSLFSTLALVVHTFLPIFDDPRLRSSYRIDRLITRELRHTAAIQLTVYELRIFISDSSFPYL